MTHLIRNPGASAIVALFAITLFFRVLSGLDVTDELQYYFQILGLAKTGTLFSNDLYIQQIVYVLLYPALQLWIAIFPDTSIILFGRILFAFGLVALFWFTYVSFDKIWKNHLISACLALCLNFAVTRHGIFAFSYNTIAQMGWLIFLLLSISATNSRNFLWATNIVVTGLAAPSSGITMAVLYASIGLFSKNGGNVLRTAIIAVSLSLALVFLLLFFSDFQTLLKSLIFSYGFGIGGLFSSQKQLFGLILTTLIILTATFLPANYKMAKVLTIVLIFSIFYLFYDIFMDYLNAQINSHSPIRFSNFQVAFYLTNICAIAVYTSKSFSKTSRKFNKTFYKIIIISLLHAISAAVISSSGYSHMSLGLLFILPISVAFLAINAAETTFVWRILTTVPSIVITTFFIVAWKFLPYRDDVVHVSGYTFANFQIASGILISKELASVNGVVFETLSALTTGRLGMIFSSRATRLSSPGLYAYLNIQPETCMIFTHSIGNEKSEKVLRDCLKTKTPEFILLLDDTGMEPRTENISAIAFENISRLGLSCHSGSMFLPSSRGGAKEPVSYTFCQ